MRQFLWFSQEFVVVEVHGIVIFQIFIVEMFFSVDRYGFFKAGVAAVEDTVATASLEFDLFPLGDVVVDDGVQAPLVEKGGQLGNGRLHLLLLLLVLFELEASVVETLVEVVSQRFPPLVHVVLLLNKQVLIANLQPSVDYRNGLYRVDRKKLEDCGAHVSVCLVNEFESEDIE